MDLTIQPEDWRPMDGPAPEEPLVIQPMGPLLSATAQGWAVLSGWRSVHGELSRRWTVVRVRQSAVTELGEPGGRAG